MRTLNCFILTLILITIEQSVFASNLKLPDASSGYKTAIGLRAGTTSGITFKHFVSSSSALEVIAGVWPYGLSGTVLLEKHANAGADGLSWYYGAGGHAVVQSGYIYHRYRHPRYDYYYRTGSALGLGIDGIVGLEYKINPVPFAISLDLKPFVEVNNIGYVFLGIDPGLGIKFTF